jgi:hypothetical protein
LVGRHPAPLFVIALGGMLTAISAARSEAKSWRN